MLTETRFLNLDCVQLSNGVISLLVPRSLGPRVLGLRHNDGPNLFAELPHFSLDCPGAGRLTLWGGHRLWHAPEVQRRTYLPDDQPVDLAPTAQGLTITQPVEAATGLQKSIALSLPDDGPRIEVTHRLRNHGMWPVRCAPWAITQLPPGGVAILPQPQEAADPDGLQPNRSLALWPYSDVGTPHVQWGNRAILVRAALKGGAFKVGFPNPRGWLAYLRQGALFVKWAHFEPGAPYLDRASSSQCYVNDQFLELETLGPEMTIPAQGGLVHREVWQIWDGVASVTTETEAVDLARRLDLDQALAGLRQGAA